MFPPLRALARELTPGVEQLPATIDAGTPWLRQTGKLVQTDELGGIAQDLKHAQPSLAAATNDLAGLLPQLQATSRCVTEGARPDRRHRHQRRFRDRLAELLRLLLRLRPARTGVGANFDGNGQLLRVQFGGGPTSFRLPISGANSPNTPLWGYTIQPPTGTQPVRPAQDPPIRTDVLCEKNAVPDLNGPAAAVRRALTGGLMRQAIGRYLKDFIAVVILAVVGLTDPVRDPLPAGIRASALVPDPR